VSQSKLDFHLSQHGDDGEETETAGARHNGTPENKSDKEEVKNIQPPIAG
jgi:hypothetical protein